MGDVKLENNRHSQMKLSLSGKAEIEEDAEKISLPETGKGSFFDSRWYIAGAWQTMVTPVGALTFLWAICDLFTTAAILKLVGEVSALTDAPRQNRRQIFRFQTFSALLVHGRLNVIHIHLAQLLRKFLDSFCMLGTVRRAGSIVVILKDHGNIVVILKDHVWKVMRGFPWSPIRPHDGTRGRA